MDDLLAKHKKELKNFDGEKRTAMKKVKGTSGKGKKGKEALAKAETEWKQKQEEILQRHANEITALSSPPSTTTTTTNESPSPTTTTTTPTPTTPAQPPTPNQNDNDQDRRKKANLKKAQKRQAQRDRQRAAEAAIIQETNDAGPSPREVELSRLTELYLSPSNLTIQEITADGNCLYRAVSAQLERLGCEEAAETGGYLGIRRICAEALEKGREDYAPFVDLESHGVDDFDGYVGKVRESNEWGGHLELRALAVGLGRTIVVYSADSAPLCIEGVGGGSVDDENAVRLSFHKSYYALGEHYNSVIRTVD